MGYYVTGYIDGRRMQDNNPYCRGEYTTLSGHNQKGIFGIKVKNPFTTPTDEFSMYIFSTDGSRDINYDGTTPFNSFVSSSAFYGSAGINSWLRGRIKRSKDDYEYPTGEFTNGN